MSKIHKNINIFNTSYDYNFLEKGLIPLQIKEFKNLKSSLGTAVKRNIKIRKDKISSMKVNNNTDKYQQPLIIFVTIYKFPEPEWAVGMDEEHLYIHWRPSRLGRFKTNYGYVKLTNWYSYHITNLLNYFLPLTFF